jgi:hypothetical protein
MPIFQHILWGYALTYPDSWVHLTIQDNEGFAAHREAFEAGYEGPGAGHFLVKAEWNGERQTVGPLWTHHIGMMAGMLGAKKVGSAPWKLGEAFGLEAEVVLPKKSNTRFWTGILTHEYLVLQFVVLHPKEVRATFEPLVTQIIRSLKFAKSVPGFSLTDRGLPLPPGYLPTDPRTIIPDIASDQNWSAYDGGSPIDALQAFFLREAPVQGWVIEGYAPFPGSGDLGFARLRLNRDEQQVTLGIMPYGEATVSASSPARLVIKTG